MRSYDLQRKATTMLWWILMLYEIHLEYTLDGCVKVSSVHVDANLHLIPTENSTKEMFSKMQTEEKH